MEATQLIDDSILEESEEEDGEKRGEPLAKLMELLLYQGENVLGRNPDSCSLPLVARSVSKQHTVISISMFRGNRRHGNVAAMETEALVWDLGSMNGTRKGRTKLTPHVRYALTEGECVVIADIPCQYVSVDKRVGQGHVWNPTNADSGRGRRTVPDRKAQLRGSPSPRNQGLDERLAHQRLRDRLRVEESMERWGHRLSWMERVELRPNPCRLNKPPHSLREHWCLNRSLTPMESERDGETNRESYLVKDESPITPSSSAKNRPKKIVSFSEEESDMDGPRQQHRRRAQVIVDDSEEEEEEKEGKEAKEALGEKETGKRTRGKEDVSVEVVNQVSQAERAGLTPSAPMVSTEDKFNTDSDTDVEGEEEMGLSAPVNGVKPPVATEPPTDSDPGQLHMDSDTDVEEGDTMGSDSKLMLTAADVERKPVDSIPVVQPTDIHLDSDTDVDDDNVVDVLEQCYQDPVEKPADSAPAVQHVVFHGDSDTDVEEEDTDTHSKTVPESDASGIRTGTAGPQEIILGSDTDEEDNPFAPPASSRTAELLKPPTSVGPATAAPLEIRSDSDTDLEEDATQTMNPTPPNVATVTEDTAVLPSHTTTTTGAVTTTIALRSQDSDADTDAEEEGLEPKTPRCQPPAGMVLESDPSEPSDFRMDSDTDEEEDGLGEAGQGQTPVRTREGAAGPGLLPLGGSPGPHQKCSTPLASPTAALSCSASDSQEDDDFVVSETQSFVLEGQDQGHQSSLPVEPTLDATQPYSLEPSLGEDRGEQPSRGSFQLGLSDSSHLQARDQTSESTKAFSFPDGELEATQAYGAGAVVPTPSSRAFLAQTVATESTQAFGSPDRDSDLEATQAYGSGGGSEEPGLGRRSAVFGRNRQVDFALEATQAYAAQPRSDIEEEDEEGEETQPLEFPTTSNVATAETLPMSACEEEEGEEEKDLVGAKPSTPVRRGRSGGAREREEEEQETQTGEVLTNQYLSTAQTRDMVQESDDEEETKPDSPRRRGQSQKQTVEEEETQPSEFLTSSHISTAETQPMGTCDTEEEKEEDNKAKGRVQRGAGERVGGCDKRRGRRGARGGEEEEEESSEPLKTQTTGKGKAVNTTRGGGRRGKVLPEEEEEEKEAEVVEQGRRGRGRKSVNQQKEGEKERLEMERREEEEGIEKEREERTEKERLRKEKVESERVMKEQQERERMERDERLERERVETERMEREKREQEERERLERERKEREEQERLERERKEKERKRLEREEKEKQEKLERESREREEKERIEGEQAEKDRLEKERKEILEKEKMEREEKKKQERERLKMENKEKERLEMKERDLKEKLERERLERETQAKKDDENEPKTSTRGHRATTRRTITVPPTTQPQPELDVLSSQPEPVPASITRSRSNSSSSERSISSMGTQGSRGRGRGRGRRGTTELAPGPDNSTRNSTRRRTVAGTVVAPPAAVEVTVQDILSSEQFVARRTRSRSSSTNSHSSLNSEVPTCSVASVSTQIKGRGGGRGRKTGTESVPPSNSQSEQPPAPKPTARGRRSQKVEDDAPHPEINKKADSQEAGGTTRGQKRTSKANDPDPEVTGEETTPAQVTEDSSPPRGNGRGRGRGGQKDNTPESTSRTAGGDTGSEAGVESKTGGKGRKRELEEEKEESSGFKVPRGKAKVQRGGRRRAAEEEKEEGEKEEKPASTPAKRGRASTAQVEKSMEGRGEKMEEEETGTVQRKVRGRHSTVQIKKAEESVLDSKSMVPQTPKGNGRGKRSATVDSSPLAKSPRSSSASPLSSLSSPGTLCRARATTQSYKVLFTGVGDEEGGKVVSRLGGSLAKGVADMTHLVTDRVRRTVKFLCAVARGVPVVTTDWLDKEVKMYDLKIVKIECTSLFCVMGWLEFFLECGKLGRFLPTDRYLVKDREQENKFSFCLEESLRTASTQPLLQGYEVHVTRSVLPEPAQMKDIITCSGARFLSKMPSTQKTQAQTVVISCGEDWSLCAPALSASLPVLSAEFLLTGILQQRVDL
ncbi:unnamed protein product, partial [Coregonus sp. 'balchen']